MFGSGVFGGWVAGAFVLLFLGLMVGSVVLLVVSLVDIVRRPDWQWRLAGQEKVTWVLLVVLVNFLAVTSLIYWFHIRRQLLAVEAAAAAGHLGPGYLTYAGWQPDPYAAWQRDPYAGHPVVPPGWHPDPSGQAQLRWWDGIRWTEQTWNEPPAQPNGGAPRHETTDGMHRTGAEGAGGASGPGGVG